MNATLAPLADGLYWTQDFAGLWVPMGVANGERFLLQPQYGAALLPDERAPIAGPLLRPKARP